MRGLLKSNDDTIPVVDGLNDRLIDFTDHYEGIIVSVLSVLDCVELFFQTGADDNIFSKLIIYLKLANNEELSNLYIEEYCLEKCKKKYEQQTLVKDFHELS